MNTYRYEIVEKIDVDGGYAVTEADGPSAPATGVYETRTEAIAAIEAVAGKPLDFEHGVDELHRKYWVVEFER